jgi:hypothetical protein
MSPTVDWQHCYLSCCKANDLLTGRLRIAPELV